MCRSLRDIPLSVGTSFGFDVPKVAVVDISCKLLYDFNRCDKLSCCNSRRVGAGLNTVRRKNQIRIRNAAKVLCGRG